MLVWADGFDHYGNTPNGGRPAMTAGQWVELSWGSGGVGTIEVSTDQKRTGGYSLRLAHAANGSTRTIARRVIGAARLIAGFGLGVYCPALPAVNKQFGFCFLNNANQNIAAVMVQSDGAIGIYTGANPDTGATLIGSSDPVITAGAWQHIETRIVIDDIVGEIEVRVNGLPVIHLTDLDLGSNHTTQLRMGTFASNSLLTPISFYVDDLVLWDDNGDTNNTFFGPARVTTLFPVADEAAADWSIVGTTDGYEAIDEVPPDGDSTYLMSDIAGDVSEFALDELPPETANIRGVYIPVMGKLEEAGTGNVQVSLVSDGEVSAGPDTVLTSAYTYWGGAHQVDPATGEPWTKEALEAAILRLEKTV